MNCTQAYRFDHRKMLDLSGMKPDLAQTEIDDYHKKGSKRR
jgi:hypothetical protein